MQSAPEGAELLNDLKIEFNVEFLEQHPVFVFKADFTMMILPGCDLFTTAGYLK
jgi:hypothetical protein